MTALFALVGAAAGAVQAALLVRAARQRSHILSLVARLGIVLAVLIIAARAGELIAAAGGWAVGFAIAAAVIYRAVLR